jgi:hypothetical protein
LKDQPILQDQALTVAQVKGQVNFCDKMLRFRNKILPTHFSKELRFIGQPWAFGALSRCG